MRRIAIINQKGGVGKTTTSVNLGVALARAGHRVLLLDLDPQAHLSLHLGINPADRRTGLYEMLTGGATISRARIRVGSNLWLVGSSIDLAAAEVELVSVVGREVILRDLLDQHTSAGAAQYDYVLMDCPPSLSVLTLNGLCAAREVFIPLQPHYLALQGLGKLLETVSLVGRRINPGLEVGGVVVCMHDAGTRLAAEVIDDVRTFFENDRDKSLPWSSARVFHSVIRRNIKLAEAPSYGQSIFDYAPGSNGAHDYEQLGREVHGGLTAVMIPATSAEEPATPAAEQPAAAGPEEPAVAAPPDDAPEPVGEPPAVSDEQPAMALPSEEEAVVASADESAKAIAVEPVIAAPGEEPPAAVHAEAPAESVADEAANEVMPIETTGPVDDQLQESARPPADVPEPAEAAAQTTTADGHECLPAQPASVDSYSCSEPPPGEPHQIDASGEPDAVHAPHPPHDASEIAHEAQVTCSAEPVQASPHAHEPHEGQEAGGDAGAPTHAGHVFEVAPAAEVGDQEDLHAQDPLEAVASHAT